MAKKQETKKEVEAPVVETPVVETPKPKKVEPKKPKWEIKDRVYYLTRKRKPLSYMVRSAGIYFFDEALGYERELKYCENQITPFVDEMKGDQRLSHIIFRNGALHVPRNKQTLQKLLSLYHPQRNTLFEEWKPEMDAADDLEVLELELEALNIAQTIDIDMAEAIMRVEYGSKVSNMSSKELKRDLLLYAKNNPVLFLELASDDNVQLRNFGIKATELGILKLSQDNRNFLWASNDRKLMTVPFEEHPYTALAHWFKTDEGMEIYKSIEKRLN
jgi:hypothetical protein